MKNKIKKLTVILGLITILANIGMASSKPSNKKAPAQKVCKDKNGKTVKCKVTQNIQLITKWSDRRICMMV